MALVPNWFPTIPDPQGRRLAVVGEAPGIDEEQTGEPFVGPSGKLLRAVLSHSGILPQSCFFGNITQHRPPDNDIETFDWHGPEIQGGIVQLTQDLHTFRPNCILALGRSAFRFFKPDKCYQGRPNKGNPSGYVIPLQDWRGSIFEGSTGHKTVACFHPAYIQRAFGDIAYFRHDVGRAVHQSTRAAITRLVRIGVLRPQLHDVLAFFHERRSTRTAASFDIEGYSDAIGVTMLSACPTPSSGIVVPFYLDGKNYWSDEEEVQVWSALSAWLADPLCPKKCHNAFYETLVLGWRHACVVDGIVSDTMMKQWEFYNELEKSLAVATSLWTEEPYYKDERESQNSDRKLLYNFKDSACTEEVDRAIEPALRRYPRAYSHYEFNVSLIPCFTYLHLRGCRFDTARAAAHRREAESELAGLIEKIDKVTMPVLGHTFNPKSTTDKQWLLYDFLGHTPFKRYGTTTKEEVILRFYNKRKDAVLLDLIRAVNLRTRISDIEKLTPSSDGRLRTAYNLVADVTGRSNSRETSIAELFYTAKGKVGHNFDGTNLQNVTKALRDVCITDGDDYTFFQADLKGADAITVAADLAALGHPAMLNDLLAGLKPSVLLLRMLDVMEAGGDPAVIARLSTADALEECKKVVIPKGILPDGRPAEWKYISMKRVQHGCVTAGHEVMTLNGWRPIETLKPGTAVLAWRADTDEAGWDVPSRLTNYNYTGRLFNFEGTAYSLEVTHDHRMPYSPATETFKVNVAERVAAIKSAQFPVSATSYDGVNLPHEQVRLLAAFQSDGCCTKREDVVAFHFAKRRKIERLKMLCQENKIMYSAYNQADGTVIIEFESDWLWKWKDTDWRLLQLSNFSLQTYLTETVLWDGSEQIEHLHKRTEITTAVKLRAEVLNTIARLCGFGSQLTLNARTSGFGSQMHSVSLNNRTRARLSSMQTTTRTVVDIPVYCITVQSGFFFVRRNNKIMITGNSNYEGKEETIAATIFKDSDGLIDVAPSEVAKYQHLYRLRYNTSARTQWMGRHLVETGGVLETACGIRRRFFGIRNPKFIDDDIIRQALASEPQANTTYATNLALKNLWFDPDNRRRSGALFVEPLLQIHDAVAGQFPSRLRDFATEKLHRWFDNELVIHGVKVKIPVDIKFGRNWGEV